MIIGFISIEWQIIGSLKGATGDKGDTGAQGYTPYIYNDYWYINGISTGVVAKGLDGQGLRIHTGTYKVVELPNFDVTDVGDGFLVTDDPTYTLALYIHGFGGLTWTITNFGGQKGEQGDRGEQGLKGDTGLQGLKGDTGLQGIQGEKGDKGDQGQQGQPGEGKYMTVLFKRSYFTQVRTYDVVQTQTGQITRAGYSDVTLLAMKFDSLPNKGNCTLSVFIDNLEGQIVELKLNERIPMQVEAITGSHSFDRVDAEVYLNEDNEIMIELSTPIIIPGIDTFGRPRLILNGVIGLL